MTVKAVDIQSNEKKEQREERRCQKHSREKDCESIAREYKIPRDIHPPSAFGRGI